MNLIIPNFIRNILFAILVLIVGGIHAIGNDNKFVCNDPFMVPAEYTDTRGNTFIMCFSEPKLGDARFIWYIQELRGNYKGVGVADYNANARGSHQGKIYPMENSFDSSASPMTPLEVQVSYDQSQKVISIIPIDNSNKYTTVEWRVKTEGFPLGSLKLPGSCGSFLSNNDQLDHLTELTGSTKRTTCQLPLGLTSNYHAYISWGTDRRSPNQRIFNLGFSSPTHGYSMDICDRGDRCQMARVRGNNYKEFKLEPSFFTNRESQTTELIRNIETFDCGTMAPAPAKQVNSPPASSSSSNVSKNLRNNPPPSIPIFKTARPYVATSTSTTKQVTSIPSPSPSPSPTVSKKPLNNPPPSVPVGMTTCTLIQKTFSVTQTTPPVTMCTVITKTEIIALKTISIAEPKFEIIQDCKKEVDEIAMVDLGFDKLLRN